MHTTSITKEANHWLCESAKASIGSKVHSCSSESWPCRAFLGTFFYNLKLLVIARYNFLPIVAPQSSCPMSHKIKKEIGQNTSEATQRSPNMLS